MLARSESSSPLTRLFWPRTRPLAVWFLFISSPLTPSFLPLVNVTTLIVLTIPPLPVRNCNVTRSARLIRVVFFWSIGLGLVAQARRSVWEGDRRLYLRHYGRDSCLFHSWISSERLNLFPFDFRSLSSLSSTFARGPGSFLIFSLVLIHTS